MAKRRQKIAGDSASTEAKKMAEKLGWGFITPDQTCKMITELKAQGHGADRIAKRFNELKVIRGNYREGDPKWSKDHVKYVYKEYGGKTLSGRTRRTRRSKKIKKQLTQTAFPQQTAATAEATRHAVQFVRQNPEYTIWSDLAVVRLLEQKRAAGQHSRDVVRKLNKDKILRSNYTTGRPEWDETNLGKLYKKVRGRTATGRQLTKRSKLVRPTKLMRVPADAGFSLKDVPRESIKDVRLVDGGYARATIEVLVPRDDPRVLEITNEAIQSWLKHR